MHLKVDKRCLKGTETQNPSGQSRVPLCISPISPYPRQTAARVIGLRDAFDEMEDLVSKMNRKSKLTQEPLDKQEKKDIRKKVKMVIKTIAAISSSPSVKLMDLYYPHSILRGKTLKDRPRNQLPAEYWPRLFAS